jgi:hypothetical protein
MVHRYKMWALMIPTRHETLLTRHRHLVIPRFFQEFKLQTENWGNRSYDHKNQWLKNSSAMMDQVPEHTVLPASPIRSAICSDMTSFPFSSNTTTWHTWKHQETRATYKSLCNKKGQKIITEHIWDRARGNWLTETYKIVRLELLHHSRVFCFNLHLYITEKKASENSTDEERTSGI